VLLTVINILVFAIMLVRIDIINYEEILLHQKNKKKMLFFSILFKKFMVKNETEKVKRDMGKQKNILVLVESPTKINKIKNFLETGHPEVKFEVLASGGHITKIPNRGKDNLGIDVQTMTPEFVNDRSKTKNITAIKKAGKKADLIVLASDPDREGEAIA